MTGKRFFLWIILGALFFNASVCNAEQVVVSSLSPQKIISVLPKNVPLQIEDKKIDLSSADISSWLSERSDLDVNPQYRTEIENIYFCRYKKSSGCALTFPVKDSFHVRKDSQTLADSEKISSYVSDLARTNNRDPESARLKVEGGSVSVFALSRKGVKIDEEKSREILIDFLKNGNWNDAVKLAYDTIEPEVTTDSIDNMGITTLIGQGRSNFKGSPKNRVFNIKVAIKRFDGVLIKPGEEFSFVRTLGEVDGDHGYLPELVIKKDKTEPEFGGGICQVSTTAFRAAIYSGLKITARKNHAYPVQYYNPQGMDSTVYIPRPDLKFVNNTPAYILIQVRIEGTELVFDFYGTDDGRKTNIIGPTITERGEDGSLKAVFTQEVFDKDGNKLREDVFRSAYDSPSKFPHPEPVLTEKPADWSENKWKRYKKEHHI